MMREREREIERERERGRERERERESERASSYKIKKVDHGGWASKHIYIISNIYV